MAFTYTNTQGIGEGLSNLAKVFAGGPGMAVDADFKRQQRAGVIADTALKQQQFDQFGDVFSNYKALQDAVGGINAGNVMDPAKAAELAKLGISYNPGTGQLLPIDPQTMAGIKAGIAGEAISPDQMQQMTAPFQSWGDTEVGGLEALQAANLNNQRSTAGGIVQQVLDRYGANGGFGGVGGGAGGTKLATPGSLTSAAGLEDINTQLDDLLYGHSNTPPSTRAAIMQLASEIAGRNRNPVGAVAQAAQLLGVDLDQKGGFMFGLGDTPLEMKTPGATVDMRSTGGGGGAGGVGVGPGGVSAGIGTQAVEDILKGFAPVLGVSPSIFDQIAAGTAVTQPGVAPDVSVPAPASAVTTADLPPVAEDSADLPPDENDVPEGMDPTTATDASVEGAPTMVGEDGSAYVKDDDGTWQPLEEDTGVQLPDGTVMRWHGDHWEPE